MLLYTFNFLDAASGKASTASKFFRALLPLNHSRGVENRTEGEASGQTITAVGYTTSVDMDFFWVGTCAPYGIQKKDLLARSKLPA